MGSFTTGLCVGLGLSLLFAPMKGEEMRRLVGERLRYLRGIPPDNLALNQSVAQIGARLQEVQNRAEQARQMGATAQSAVQETASSAQDIQRDLNHVMQQAGSTTPSTVQETTSNTEETQQEMNRAAQQMGATIPGTAQETTSSTKETQQEMNRVTRQPGTGNPPPQRRPRG